MRWIRYFLLIISLVALQTALFPNLRVWGATPDLLLVATIAVAYERGPETGTVFGFASGIAIDCFLSTPLGASALAFALVGYGVGVFQSGLVRSSRWIAPILGGIGGFIGRCLFVVVATIAGHEHLLDAATLRIIVVSACYDALLAFLVFPFVHWVCGDHPYVRR